MSHIEGVKDAETAAGICRTRRIIVSETIGCALAVLRRLDYVWYDEDIRDVITQVRSSLSVAQSKIKQRIDQSIQEGTL